MDFSPFLAEKPPKYWNLDHFQIWPKIDLENDQDPHIFDFPFLAKNGPKMTKKGPF